jgi:hypothetical protein
MSGKSVLFVSGQTRRYSVILLAVSIIVALFAASTFAQEAMEYPSIVASADGVTLPEGLVSGINTITLQNDSEIDFNPAIGRFVNDATMEDFMAAMQAQDFEGMLATISVLGSPVVAPEESADVTYDLQAGEYLFINFNPAGPPTLLPFTVAENEGDVVEAPEADVEIEMLDFAFAMPVELTTGESVWHFSNTGETIHEIIFYAVDEEATIESVTAAITEAMMTGAPGAPPEMPYERVYSFVGLSPNENAWMTVDLPPGTYAAVCVIPDFSTTPPSTHMHNGMIALVTVGE